MNEWLQSVVKIKKTSTHALPESPLHLIQQNVVFFMGERREKNFILFHPLSFAYSLLLFDIVCQVCMFLFSRSRSLSLSLGPREQHRPHANLRPCSIMSWN